MAGLSNWRNRLQHQSDREEMETTLLGWINELEETLAASESVREQMETTLCGGINVQL